MKDKYMPGDFVRYKVKNQLGVVGQVDDDRHVRCWWHTGGTRSRIHIREIERLSHRSIVDCDEIFFNEYARASLIERSMRIVDKVGPVDDLIDDEDVRPVIRHMLDKNNKLKKENINNDSK